MTVKPTYEELERRVQELEKAESERNFTEDRLKKILDNTQDAIFIHDLEGNVLDVNDKMCRMYGLTKEEALAVSIKDVSSPRLSMKILLERWNKALNGEKLLFEWEARRPKDQSLFNVEVSIQMINIHDKDIILANIRDITERKRVEEALKEKTQLLQNITDNMFDLVSLTDMKGNFTFLGASHKILKYDLEHLIGKNVLEFIHPEDLPKTSSAFNDFLLNLDDNQKVEYRYRCADGTYIWLETVGRFIKDDKGNPKEILFSSRDITGRKSTEKELVKEATRRRILMEQSGDGIVILDQTGQLIESNQRFADMLGYPFESMCQLKVFDWEFHYPPDRIIEMINSVDEKGDHFETKHRRRDGSTYDVEISSNAAWFEEQKLIFCICRDITERKQAEQSLAESETRYKALHNASFGGITIHDQGIILECNQGLVEMTGYKYSEIIGMDGLQLIAEKSREAVMNNIQTGYEKSYEAFGLRKNGEEFPIQLEARNVPYKGKLVRTVEFREITERKKAENVLRESEELLSRSQELAHIGTWRLDLIENKLTWSDEIYRIFGYKPQEFPVTYEAFLDAVHPDDREMVNNAYTDSIREGRNEYEIQHRIFRRNTGETRTLHERCIHERDEAGTIVRSIGMVQDITERKQAEMEREMLQEQLSHAQKMESVGRLAGGVAHDFNNMLGVILGHTELALLQADENHDLYDDLKEIQKAAKRSANLTKQLLTFARKDIISPRRIELNDTVESMLNMLRRLIGEDIDLVWKPSAHLWPVKMDPSQIDQILANLCINARDAISGVGKLTIETGRKTFDEEYCKEHAGFIPGDFVLLAVSDNGSGMDKDTLENLFEPFFTTKEVGKGTGLGLATIYGIVKQNNGFINVYSEPGQGSTFKIYLPRLVADEDTDMTMPEKKAAIGGTETILLVEDEPSILKMTRMMLEKKGYNVLSSATPAEAMEKAKSHFGAIDLLMTDVVMPEMNGRDLAAKVTALHPDIRLLFMSGYTADVIAHQGVLDAGVAFIQKPFSLADMTEMVRNILDSAPNKN